MHLVVKRFVPCIQPVSAMNGRPTIAARRWAEAHSVSHENISHYEALMMKIFIKISDFIGKKYLFST